MTRADDSPKSRVLRLAALFRRLTREPSSNRVELPAPNRHDPVESLRRERGSAPVPCVDLAVSQFAHDLRNQLTLINGCADDIARLLPVGEGQERLAELMRAVDRAAVLTRELLMTADPRAAVRRILDANAVVASGASTFAALASDRITLRLSLCEEPLMVAAEHSDLERILLNLALNARDAMPGGGVLTIETSVVAPSAGARRDGVHPYARLTVTDTGVGMTPEIKARIFEPMFTTKARGTGLGLTTVAFTVRQLHGMISVESEVGRGTAVSVILPLSPPS